MRPGDIRGSTAMGEKSEAFCRQALQVLQANPQIVPASLGLDEAVADLAALDALRPRLIQLRQLTERAHDTERALGSDIMAASIEAYALLKVSGRDEGLKAARRELSTRWARARRNQDGDTPEPPAAAG